MSIQKRFPAETQLDYSTFLNDKKVNGELYAYLQSISKPYKTDMGVMQTRVYVKDLPKQPVICQAAQVKSPKTLKVHLEYLKTAGYLTEAANGEYYILEDREKAFLMIPLNTLSFLMDVVQEHIIKIYVYLGQKYKYALSEGRSYEFTIQELADHIGLKTNGNARTYEVIKNALSALADFELIEYGSYFNGVAAKKKLVNYSYEYKDNEQKRLEWKQKQK